MAYRIKNWEKFQHYKNKIPGARLPWIKLYPSLLNDVEFNRLSGDDAKVLIMLWMVGSDTDGVLPAIDQLSFRLRTSESKITGSLSRLSHFIYRDSSDTLDSVHSNSPKLREDKLREEKEHVRASDLLFETFWKTYPKKVAKDVARKAWEKIRPTDELLRIIIQALEKWKKTDQWRKDDGQFIPHPATWLNQRRWEDEIKVSAGHRDPLDKLFGPAGQNKSPDSAIREPGQANSLGEVSSLFRRVDKA